MMDYIKEAEAYLKYYANLKKSVTHAKYMMGRLANQVYITEKGGYRCGDLCMWQEICRQNEAEICHIEEMLCGLTEKERQVLELYYIEKMRVADIAAELDYEGRKSVYNLKSKALKNFAVNLFGSGAWKRA